MGSSIIRTKANIRHYCRQNKLQIFIYFLIMKVYLEVPEMRTNEVCETSDLDGHDFSHSCQPINRYQCYAPTNSISSNIMLNNKIK